jgi:predicted XRE-type DNA-binding protein
MKTKTPQTRGKKSAMKRASSRRTKGQQPNAPARRPHVTPPGGNVFSDLGFPDDEAENLKIRAALMSEMRGLIAGITQADGARLLGVTQPRVSDLKRGKIGLFTIDALVNMLSHAGITIRLSISRPRKSAA